MIKVISCDDNFLKEKHHEECRFLGLHRQKVEEFFKFSPPYADIKKEHL